MLKKISNCITTIGHTVTSGKKMLVKCFHFIPASVAHLSCWMKTLSFNTVSNSLMCHWWHDFEIDSLDSSLLTTRKLWMVQKQYPISRYKDISVLLCLSWHCMNQHCYGQQNILDKTDIKYRWNHIGHKHSGYWNIDVTYNGKVRWICGGEIGYFFPKLPERTSHNTQFKN